MGTTKGGLRAIAGAVDNAKPAPKVGTKPDPQSPELPMLPPGCPVIPLGKLGQICYYLDEMRQLIGLDPQKHGKTHILNLFGRRADLCLEYWPRLNRRGVQDGWHPETAAQILMASSAMAGIFDPQGRVHGRGAHLGDNGELIVHCGDVVFVADEHGGFEQPGMIAGHVYPTAPAIPRPDPAKQGTAPAETLLALFRSWSWSRSLIDPMLLLGFVGCAMIGGALGWRPHVWITGGSATGKSTLQKVLEYLFDGGALHTQDATEASLRQLLKQQTLPVFFDELEANEDNRRAKAVINLARLASSGGEIFRGGQDHEGHTFKAKTCFLFSSILLPPMLAQDRNRLAILELEKIPPGQGAPVIDPGELKAIGRQLRRRLIDEWPRLEAVLDRYRHELEAVGHGGRSQDQFGTLLAVADLLLYDVAEEDTIAETAGWLAADSLAEKATELADEEEVAAFLASSFLQQRGGDEPEPLSRHIRSAIQPDGDRARARLENFGLRVGSRKETVKADGSIAVGFEERYDRPAGELYLAIANRHVGLEKVFQGTRWEEGTWTQSFGRIEGSCRRVKVRFAGAKPSWATLVPLSSILDFDERPA